MELVHALNRGVDKRRIFLDRNDYLRFAYGLKIFNTTKPVEIAALKAKGLTMSFEAEKDAEKDRLVNIHAWCLMKNHFHLLLTSKKEGGISLFLKKLNIGYAKYFNERYHRNGTLFQGRTKQIQIVSDAHFLHILGYIHFNPLDYLQGSQKWREGAVGNAERALGYLDVYEWSSYQYYCGSTKYIGIVSTDIFDDQMGKYRAVAAEYLRDREIEIPQGINLE